MPAISVHIVTFNSAATLRACLDGLRAQVFTDYEAHVFDNASTDDTRQIVRDAGLHLIESSDNLGYAQAHNRLMRDAYHKHTPPVRGTRRLKLLYASQVAVAPPFILIHVNDPRLVHFTYKRFLENQIREVYPFAGTPLRLSFRSRDGDLDE